MLHLFNKHATPSCENIAPSSSEGMQNMPFLRGTDCNSKAILVSFPSIYISLELAWIFFSTSYQNFTF